MTAVTPRMQSIRCVWWRNGTQSYITDAFPKENSFSVSDDYSALRRVHGGPRPVGCKARRSTTSCTLSHP